MPDDGSADASHHLTVPSAADRQCLPRPTIVETAMGEASGILMSQEHTTGYGRDRALRTIRVSNAVSLKGDGVPSASGCGCPVIDASGDLVDLVFDLRGGRIGGLAGVNYVSTCRTQL